MEKNVRILLVEDDPDMLRGLEKFIFREGYSVFSTENAEDALKIFQEKGFDLLLSDVKLPGMDGIELLSKVKESSPKTPVIIFTGYGTIENAVDAMKIGAFEYLLKPLDLEELKATIQRALTPEETAPGRKAGTRPEDQPVFTDIIGQSQKLLDVLSITKKVAPTDTTVLIQGESGTGKELIARAIHENSKRRSNIFVPVDCGALTETLLESELFGHVKGSFTGAIATKRGLFEIARGGTIFFDEVGDISHNVQSKLLRVLEERVFLPVGGSEFISTDIRLITATNRFLEQQVKEGSFREDLYYRLNVVSIFVPPLRERKEDIPILVDHFRKRFNRKLGKNVKVISKEVMEILEGYDWPGNVRELENLVERLIVLTGEERISLTDLPPTIISAGLSKRQPAKDFSAHCEARKRMTDAFDRMFVVEALKNSQGNVSQAARSVNMNRANFQRMMRRLGIRN